MSWHRLTHDLNAAQGNALRLRRARVATATMHDKLRPHWPGASDALVDLSVHDGRITAVEPAVTGAVDGIDVQGRWLLPPFADAHVHLDKTHTASRLDHSQPSLLSAVRATMGDRPRWTPDDLERRAEHAIRLALAHGTTTLRTHIDVRPGEAWTGWGTLLRLRSRWQAHLRIDMVAMLPMEVYLQDAFPAMADRIAGDGGILGGVTKAMGKPPAAERQLVTAALDTMMQAARARDLAVDLHVDESCDPTATSLDWVADKTLEHRMEGRVTCGHCCSLSHREAPTAMATLQRARAAGLCFVTLPTANAYLQDRAPGRTPRLRGIAPVLEMKAAGLAVAVASDNCGDAFYPFGRYDLLDVLGAAIRMAHLDAPLSDWLSSVTSTPSMLAGTGRDTRLAVGASADFNLFDATDVYALLSCPQSRRVFVRSGQMVEHDWPENLESTA